MWAVAANGDVLYREKVRPSCPEGAAWIHVPSDVVFQAVSAGEGGKVWAVGKDGNAYYRHGVSEVAPTGQTWLQVHRPGGNGSEEGKLKAISVGGPGMVWAVDVANRLHLRLEVK